MLIALATAPFDSTAIMALPIYAAALVARSASDDTLRLRLSVITVPTLTGFFLSSILGRFGLHSHPCDHDLGH